MSRKKIVQKKMKQLQITQQQLAQHVMLSEKQIDLWINKKKELPYEVVSKITDILDCDLLELWVVL